MATCAAVRLPATALRRPSLQLPLQPRLRSAAAAAARRPAAHPRAAASPGMQPQQPSQQRHAQQQQQQRQQQQLAKQPAGWQALLARLLQPRVLAGVAACGLLAALLPAAAQAAAAAAGGSAASSSGGFAALAKSAVSWVLHLDVHLGEIVAKYGTTTYWILFAIVFAETGLVVTPFLPGDSLLFATGALAALGKLNLPLLAGCYIAAATLGDAVNYAIGNALGSAALNSRLLKKEHIAKTEEFYSKYGGKTVVLARFVPIVRTFAPFVAGVGSMSYTQFGLYNVAGAVLWTAVCVGAGFAFGNVPAVHENFSLVVLGIVLVSLLPIAWEMYAAKKEAAATAAAAKKEQEQIPHSTPASAAAAVESAGLPPRIFPAAVAAAAEAVDIARAKVADPLEEERQDVFCKDNPGADECKVYDD